MIKGVVDTNVLVSSAFNRTGPPARVIDLAIAGAFSLIVSEAILSEYEALLSRDKIRSALGISVADAWDSLREVRRLAQIVVPIPLPHIEIGDPNDLMFVECAVAADADVIVSGDRHLLSLGAYGRIQVIRPADFASMIEENRWS